MRWSRNTTQIRPRVPLAKIEAIISFAQREGFDYKITNQCDGHATVETRGLNPAGQRRIDAWLRSDTPLTEEPARVTHFGGLARTRFTV